MNRNQRRMAEYNARKAAQQIDAGNYAGKINRAFAKLSGEPSPRVEQALRAPNWREPKEDASGSICIPQVAIFQAGHRKSENITAR
ncbi:transcriptional regulator [Enterobacter sp. R1(2018)]|uniref:transcriptional antitermination N peptide n=1 Tax=Enterobacter sp. R1(2018) TaxID=2447891 RepID=UPI000EB047D3|nr:transcriptional regulator [Enterobacter sp. R1(2018)]RKQ38363.1 transcriptional regulator [Enterobacter sp. R1(2018)]